MKRYYVYVLASKTRVLYTGVTNNLKRRVWEHKKKLVPGFTRKYNISRLVYFESSSEIRPAISREKEIKGWVRRKKVALIERVNPRWKDLSEGWYEEIES